MEYGCKYITLSPAKINLFLKVLNKREDGYHNILSIVQKISLFDVIKIKVINNKKNEVKISFSNKDVNPEENTVYSAISYFKSDFEFKDSIEVFIDKKIPMEAGLGGGSSNAATVLKFINDFYKRPLKEERLLKIGLSVGADVPLFISDKKTLLMRGIGEKVEEYRTDMVKYFILIVKPRFSISTKWAYKNLNLELTNKFKSINRAPSQISEFFNDLENAVLIKYPEINYIKNMLYKGGAFFSLMTGSGSAVFGLFKEHNEALHCLEQIKNRYYKIFLTKTLV